MATLRPQVDEARLRRMVEDVLTARSSALLPNPDTAPVAPADPAPAVPPVKALGRGEIEEIVRGLLPNPDTVPVAPPAADLADQIKNLIDAADFEFSDGLTIKPGRALSQAEFDKWKATVTSGQTVVQASGQTLVVNDWFTPEMQADVLLAKPQMQHSRAVYDILKERAKPGMKVRMFGNFNMAKLEGVEPEIFGADGRTADTPALASVVNGCQPTMILRFDNNDIDFSQCRFIVQTMMTDGYAVAGYKGKSRLPIPSKPKPQLQSKN